MAIFTKTYDETSVKYALLLKGRLFENEMPHESDINGVAKSTKKCIVNQIEEHFADDKKVMYAIEQMEDEGIDLEFGNDEEIADIMVYLADV